MSLIQKISLKALGIKPFEVIESQNGEIMEKNLPKYYSDQSSTH